jgi:uncharacterized membrane protein
MNIILAIFILFIIIITVCAFYSEYSNYKEISEEKEEILNKLRKFLESQTKEQLIERLVNIVKTFPLSTFEYLKNNLK